MRSEACSSDENELKESTSSVDANKVVKEIQSFCEDITKRVGENSVVAEGMQTFLRRYKSWTETEMFNNARLSSALHRFGWVFGGTVSSSQGGHMRRGRRIPVNPKSAGRRRKCMTRGKAKQLPGRPKGMKVAQYPPSQFQLPCRRPPPGKRPHSLQSNILSGTQNGGKW